MAIKKDEYDSDAVNDVINLLTRDQRGDKTENGLTSFTNSEAADHIDRANTSWNGSDLGHHATVTYAFPDDWSFFAQNGGGDTFLRGFDEHQQDEARLSLQSWADVADITFEEVSPDDKSADITFGSYVGIGAASAAYAFLPIGHGQVEQLDYSGRDVQGQVWTNVESSQAYNSDPELWGYGRQTLTHEIGHALGLSHPGDYNAGEGSPSYADADYAEDSRQYSLMSYWSEQETGGDNQGSYAAAPLLDDISAIQKLYGANNDIRTGDTVYGFNSNAERDFYEADSSNDPLIFSVWDAGGENTFDFSGYDQDQKINLNQLSFSDVGGMTGNISIADGTVIQDAVSGSGNDVIIGNDSDNKIDGGAGDDVIYGGKGADVLTGGSGSDTFVYLDADESTSQAEDTITDFQSGEDTIDLSALSKLYGDIHFVDAFDHNAGEATLNYDAQSGHSELALDSTGQATPDFMIDIVGQVDTQDVLVA